MSVRFGAKRPAIFKADKLDGWEYTGDLPANTVERVVINEDVSCPDFHETISAGGEIMEPSRCVRLLVGTTVVVGLLAATAPVSGAAEAALEVLECFRGRGDFDEALQYLEQMRDSSAASEEFKRRIDYEAGVTLISAARAAPDTSVRQRKFDQARARFRNFIDQHPGDPSISSAKMQMANLLVEQGRTEAALAERPDRPAEEKRKLEEAARGLYREAEKVFRELEELAVAKHREFPKFIDPKQGELLEQRDLVRRDLLQARLALATITYEIGMTYAPGSEQHKQTLTAAAEQYNLFYEKYSSRLGGLYARMWKGRCYKELGETGKAFDAFEDLLSQPDEPQAFRLLKNKAAALALETALLPKAKKYKEAVALYKAWEETARPDEGTSAEGLAIKFLSAEAALKYAGTLKEDDPDQAGLRRQTLQLGYRLFRQVARSSGQYQKEAKARLAEKPADLPDEPALPKDQPGGVEVLTDAKLAAMDSPPRLRRGRSPGSETAVALALKWLADHQMADGGWSFDHTQAPKCRGACRNPGKLTGVGNAATAMALLPFLGVGQTHKSGKYKSTVKGGLDFLVNQIEFSAKGGDFSEAGGGMYSHGLAATALCKAYAMTHDKGLHKPAQAAINFIAHAQDPVSGGWRYEPEQKCDIAVFGLQIAALKSGHMAYLRVPPETVKKAAEYLDGVQANGGANYGYKDPGTGPATTAVGLLCRMYLGWKKDNPALTRGLEWLSKRGPSEDHMYYNFYATEVMQLWGGEHWKKWNGAIREQLVDSQSTKGHEAGSWYFGAGTDPGAERGGRLYSTSMAAYILEVYYRRPRWRPPASEDDFPID